MQAPRSAWAVLLAAIVSTGLGAQNTRDEQREDPEVRKLSFKGVKHFDVHDLVKSVSTQASKCRSLLIKPFCLFSHSPTFEDKHYLNRPELSRDVLRVRLFFWKRGYRDAEVDTTVERTGEREVAVTFNIKENAPTVEAAATLTSLETPSKS